MRGNFIMTLAELETRLDNYKSGTFVKAAWARNIESAKAKKLGFEIIKKSNGLIRTEINYQNLQKVLAKLSANNDPTEKKESWFEHYSKGILQNKKNPEKKYLQAFPITHSKIISTYLLNGEQADPYALYEQGLITKAALPSIDTAELLTFTISIDNLVEFGN